MFEQELAVFFLKGAAAMVFLLGLPFLSTLLRSLDEGLAAGLIPSGPGVAPRVSPSRPRSGNGPACFAPAGCIAQAPPALQGVHPAVPALAPALQADDINPRNGLLAFVAPPIEASFDKKRGRLPLEPGKWWYFEQKSR